MRAVAVVLACCSGVAACGDDDDGGVATQPPSTTGSPPSSAPVTTAPETTPAITSSPTTEPVGDVPGPVVTDVGWDGEGSACVALGAAGAGCFPGGMITAEPTAANVRTEDGWRTVEVRVDGGEVTATAVPGDEACDASGVGPADAWLVDLACGEGGAALWGALPDRPAGEVRYEAARAGSGELVELAPLSRDGELHVYATDVALGGVEVRCTLVAPRTGGWSESCDLRSPAHPGTRLVVQDGTTFHLDPADGRVLPLGDAPMRANGCEQAVVDIVAAMDEVVMLGSLACRDGRATGAFGSVFVQDGPVDGGLIVWQQDDAGAWTVLDTGTGIEPDPLPLPLPPVDIVALDADAPATGFEEITDQVRGWMDARPELTIADAIAAGDGDVANAVSLATSAMAALPSLTVVEVRYPDDSVTGARYALWTTEPDDDRHPLMAAYRWTLCDRGVTADGLCV